MPQLLPLLIQNPGGWVGSAHLLCMILLLPSLTITSDCPIQLLMTALYNAILPFFPSSTKGNEKLVNRDIKNYPPYIDLDRKSLRQFTLSQMNYLQEWSITITVTLTVTIICKNIYRIYIQNVQTCVLLIHELYL